MNDNAVNNTILTPQPDLNIAAYITQENLEEAAITWGKWCNFIRKLRFFRMTQLEDILGALVIYGRDEIE